MQINSLQLLDPEGVLYSNTPEKAISTLCYDSRLASSNCAFFCFPGTVSNGEQFVSQAIEKGASVIISNRELERIEGISYFVSKCPTRTLYAKASALFFNYPAKKLTMIGVTGTDGKTSTSYFTYQLFNLFNKKAGLLNTVNYSIGTELNINNTHLSTPESFFINQTIDEAVNNGCEYFILEATSHALSDEYNRIADIKFDLSAYTNISSEHLEFHKTYERYIEAKCNLVKKTKANCFIYDSNKEIEKIKREAKKKLTVLTPPTIVKHEFDKLYFSYNGKTYLLPFGQDYNLENAFEAANIVATALKLELDVVLEKLQYLKAVRGRFQIIENQIKRNIIIDFAHTPKAYQAIMENTKSYKKDHKFIALFGSSGKRDSSKRPLMGKVLSEFCDILIITEDDNRGEDLATIFSELTKEITRKDIKILKIDNREDAIKKALALSQEGDFIFCLGLGPQQGLDKGTYTKEWDEESVVKACIAEMKD